MDNSTAVTRIEAVRATAAMRPHGTRARYVAGRCRCMQCRAANSRYQCERDAAKRSGDYRGLVNVNEVRCGHLSSRGMGYKAVAYAAGVAPSILGMVLNGKRTRMRADAVQRVLSVGLDGAADGMLVSAKATWHLVNELIEGGYTRGWIAAQLGSESKTPSLQIGAAHVRAITASRVERLYRRVMDGRVSR